MTPEETALAYFDRLGPLLAGPDDPNVELLLPQLRSSVWESPHGSVMIKHPWVNMIAPFVGQANDTYIAKFSMARKFLTERDLNAYLFLVVERPWRMSTLERWWIRGKLSEDVARELLVEAWTDTELPSTNLRDPGRLWRDLAFVTDNPDEWENVSDPVTAYRGGVQGGISWTLNREQAEWFARRFVFEPNEPQLWSTTVPKEEVLGYLTRRGEAEVILDPYEVEWHEEELGDED